MSVSERWLLPDGVDELLPPEAWSVELMRRELLDLYSRYGYQLISPPLIEYLESLLTGTGNNLDLQTFKVTDQLTGRLMGVRADITPQVARIDAHLLQSKGISRLCYVDTVLHTRPVHIQTNRNPLQIGCELFGEASSNADIEVISLMLETLATVGIPNIHIDLAHVGIYKGLIESSSLDVDTEEKIFDALSRKSIPELDDLAVNTATDANIILLIRDIANLSGGIDALDKIEETVTKLNLSSANLIVDAINELRLIATQIHKRFEQVEIGFDFCELRGYNYHTGILFAAYSACYGYALAKGGRYNDIGKGFSQTSQLRSNNTRPATGFSADLKTLVRLSSKHREEPSKIIFAPKGDESALLDKINELRIKHCVIQGLSDNETPESLGCNQVLVFEEQGWQLKPVE
jgi:ATP phosphoribosyltransferase regulatory subunit